MEREKVINFQSFAKKAVEKIEAKKKMRRKSLYIGDLEETIEIRALTDQEMSDCFEYSEDDYTNDKYTMYYASPTLQELAKYMKQEGMIQNHLDVCDSISKVDRNKIVHEILALSGALGESTVKELDEVKK
ncbi:hypothetical protein D7X87_20580 [bacterium D16-54]|nr:hypothetical protein D7X87_20580 [bacterium D16-54]RKJ11713.1 hypothetical protein D7X65_21015 [bacterium D16-56]